MALVATGLRPPRALISDAERFGELVQDPDVKSPLLDNTMHSVERGTFGSPTFFVGDEIFFGKDRLRDVEEMILASS